MAGHKKFKVLKVIFISLGLIILGAAGYTAWLTQHYKKILKQKIPAYIAKGSDEMYHISFSDVSVNIFQHRITITNIKLWADSNRVNQLRQQGHYAPNTLSYVSIPIAECENITWDSLLADRTFFCGSLTVRHPVWFMQTVKHNPDMSQAPDGKSKSLIHRLEISEFHIIDPDVTYHFVGDSNSYYCYLKGGVADLHDWIINADSLKDTSTFLYAKYGTVKPASFELKKDGRNYDVAHPNIEFTSTDSSITLKNVKLEHLVDIDRKTQQRMEIYNLVFPSLQFNNFSWNKLLQKDVLVTSDIYAMRPYIDVHYERQYFPTDIDKTGEYPQQIIREFIKVYVKTLHIKSGIIKYSEPGTHDKGESTFQFDDINGTFSNITNLPHRIEHDNICVVDLTSKFMNKSPVGALFHLSLSDPKGHFTVKGYMENLDGNDVSKQAAAFTVSKVTSFHLSRMDAYIEGNESAARGNYKMLYDGLKISLFKFKSDERQKPDGPFAFLADATIIYPSNPMPGKNPRTTTTQLTRDVSHGFINFIWQNIYLGAQKTAVRDEKFLTIAGGDKEDKDAAKKDDGKSDNNSNSDKPKKNGVFARLFSHPLFGKKKSN